MPAAPPPATADLACFRCGDVQPFDLHAYLCPSCGAGEGDPGILDVRYDYDEVRARLPRSGLGGGKAGRGGVFRYQAFLPVAAPRVPLLPAGGTPLLSSPRLAKHFGLKALYLKDETANPTQCLKDRATAVAVSLAAARGQDTLYCASAGNAAISLAGFCAAARLACHVWVPARVSFARLAWLHRFGAAVHVSTGDYDRAFDESEAEGARRGWFSRNCAFNPFLVEGKKTAALEVAEQLGGRVPDLVVAPVGDGCTLAAMGKGFRELREVGRAEALPRLVGVQAEGVQPLVRRFRGEADADEEGRTRAASIAVRHPRNARRLLRELEASGGTMLAVPDAETERAAALLSAEAGVRAEFTSAAALAGLARLAEAESLEGKTAVVLVTGGRAE
ncbi:MAG TPA: pyridoxal-phosphate dependent enzyme [Longimicrobium sp.]|jgi:threonine synthase